MLVGTNPLFQTIVKVVVEDEPAGVSKGDIFTHDFESEQGGHVTELVMVSSVNHGGPDTIEECVSVLVGHDSGFFRREDRVVITIEEVA